MIFVTAGTQEPFDRLIKVVDRIAGILNEEIIVQSLQGKHIPENVKMYDFLPPSVFDNLFDQARVVVSHAGMGTIINALTKEKPLVIIPRIAALGEHRNEHQLATTTKIKEYNYAHVVDDKDRLYDDLLFFLSNTELKPLSKTKIGEFASDSLISSIASFSLRRKR